LNTFAIFKTENATKYLTTICNHFGKKVEAKYDADKGWVQFPFGRCDMTADDSRLELRVSADNENHLGQVIQIVTSHLERFAFRENPMLDWQKKSN
jgi:uncharacterized protein